MDLKLDNTEIQLRQAWMLLDFHRLSRQRKMKTDAWLKSSCNLLDKCTSRISKLLHQGEDIGSFSVNRQV